MLKLTLTNFTKLHSYIGLEDKRKVVFNLNNKNELCYVDRIQKEKLMVKKPIKTRICGIKGLVFTLVSDGMYVCDNSVFQMCFKISYKFHTFSFFDLFGSAIFIF